VSRGGPASEPLRVKTNMPGCPFPLGTARVDDWAGPARPPDPPAVLAGTQQGTRWIGEELTPCIMAGPERGYPSTGSLIRVIFACQHYEGERVDRTVTTL
jgi:hypothetical protein